MRSSCPVSNTLSAQSQLSPRASWVSLSLSSPRCCRTRMPTLGLRSKHRDVAVETMASRWLHCTATFDRIQWSAESRLLACLGLKFVPLSSATTKSPLLIRHASLEMRKSRACGRTHSRQHLVVNALYQNTVSGMDDRHQSHFGTENGWHRNPFLQRPSVGCPDLAVVAQRHLELMRAPGQFLFLGHVQSNHQLHVAVPAARSRRQTVSPLTRGLFMRRQ